MGEQLHRIFDLLELYRGKYSSKKDVFTFRKGNVWRTFSGSEYIDFADRVSAGLLFLGAQKGDKIATIMQNCPAWNYIDMGIMQIGAVHVPVYPTLSQSNFLHIFNHADVRFIFVFDKSIYNRIRDLLPRIPTLEAVFSIEKTEGVRHWKELIELGKKEFNINKINQIKSEIKSDDLATIIYTSGTTGACKGVMLSHRNFISNFTATAAIVEPKNIVRALSFLPLCHVYERMLNYMYQYLGINICYAESIEKIGENLREHQPDMMCAVPRMLEKVYARFVSKGHALKGARKEIYFWALDLALHFELHHKNGFTYEFKRKVADYFVYRKWRRALGGKLRFIVSGGASLRPGIARVFWAANIQVMEGYGLTETSPVVAVSNFEPDGVKFGTVGPALKGVEIKIAPDGEILCKGPNLMLGYYKNPELTSEVIDKDGWFHTGDIGMLEDKKYLKITDRKKEIFKTSGGKYIAPQAIENRFKESEFIENLIVVGENKHFAAAIIVPNFEHLKGWYAAKGYDFIPPSKAIKDERVINRIQHELDELNLMLDKTEQIKAFRLVDADWTPETGELSLTLKLRRQFIQDKFRGLIYDMYDAR